jgi:hypothetical protein
MKNAIPDRIRIDGPPPARGGRVSINLPYERAEQLRKLATRHGVQVTELIERWIVRELEELGEKSTPPAGYLTTLMAIGKERLVLFEVDGLPLTALASAEAQALSDALFSAADKNEATVLPRTARGNRHIEVRRQGRGVVLSIDGHRRSMTPLIATDLGTMLHFDAINAVDSEDGDPRFKRKPAVGREGELKQALQKGPRA